MPALWEASPGLAPGGRHERNVPLLYCRGEFGWQGGTASGATPFATMAGRYARRGHAWGAVGASYRCFRPPQTPFVLRPSRIRGLRSNLWSQSGFDLCARLLNGGSEAHTPHKSLVCRGHGAGTGQTEKYVFPAIDGAGSGHILALTFQARRHQRDFFLAVPHETL